MCERGARLLAVMDHSGVIAHERGLDARRLAQHVESQGGVKGFAESEPITADQFYTMKVDLFIPAALEQMVTLDVARKLDCKVLAEAANAPTIPAADNHLRSRGVQILPAILCNAGGVTVSYFEWRQNRQAEVWTLERVDQELRSTMVAAARRVKLAAHRYNCDMNTAAYAAAMEFIDKVYQLRGLFP
jgi:glutamate dehydrogenase (NAD(P)+)